jgi:hypothetical protein
MLLLQIIIITPVHMFGLDNGFAVRATLQKLHTCYCISDAAAALSVPALGTPPYFDIGTNTQLTNDHK